MASVGNSKALIGCIFLQYCSYAVFYLLDEFFKIAPPMYRPLIKEQEEANEVPNVLKKRFNMMSGQRDNQSNNKQQRDQEEEDEPRKKKNNRQEEEFEGGRRNDNDDDDAERPSAVSEQSNPPAEEQPKP